MVNRQQCEIAVYLTIYLALKVGLNYYNNWLLSKPPTGLGFPSALFYTMCHMVASVLGSTILMYSVPGVGKLSCEQFSNAKWKLLSLSLLFCLSIGANNLSLAHIGLSVNQVLKATCALFVLFFSFVLERKTHSKAKIALILLIVVGTILSVPWGTPNAEPLGIVLCLTSVVAVAAKTSLGSILMKDAKKEGLTPMVLVWYESLFSIFYLLIALCLLGEPQKLAEFAEERPENVRVAVLVALGGSLMAFTYNFVSFKFLMLTSSITHTICGNVTLVAVVVVPAIFIDHITGALSWIGFSIFLLASAAYTVVGHREAQAKKAAAAAAATSPADAKAPSEATPLTSRKGDSKE